MYNIANVGWQLVHYTVYGTQKTDNGLIHLLFHSLVSKIWARTDYGRQRWHSLTIRRHLEYAIPTELVVELELALIERKQSGIFWHNSLIC